MGPTSPPNCHVACPRATTSVILSMNLALCFIHGEKKICMGIYMFLLFLEIPYGQPNISNTSALLPLLMRILPYMILVATK